MISALLISILQTANSPTTNKLIFVDSINKIDDGKVIIEANSKKFGVEFFTSKAKLAFTKLRQTFNIALIFYYFDLKYSL